MAKHGQRLLLLACLAMVLQVAAAKSNVSVVSWADGKTSWEQASTSSGDETLWTQPNFCDTRVLHGSAPLTVLFGVSSFWDEIKHRRETLAAQGLAPSADGKPLEVHVLGAAYPFEGRSDWSLLASRRPADIPKVRVVLVLGTPWHQDNVPVMNAQEFDEARSFLMQFGSSVRKPETGKWKNGAIQCKKDGNLRDEDQDFLIKDLCKDHGNGLEVVCMEKYYQDAWDELPKPDVVAMFSPGFPQIARRSWDQVLRKLLAMEVPIMVGDLLYSDKLENVFVQKKSKVVARPGKKWAVKESSLEDGMTLRTMRAYGARRLGAFRNPFPILIEKGRSDITAKNAVLQVFRGRLSSAKPLVLPSEKMAAKRHKSISALDLKHFMEDTSSAGEIKSSMLISTSKAYDRAMWKLYRKQIKEDVQRKMRNAESKGKTLPKAWVKRVVDMGLTGKSRKKPWTLNEWIFVLRDLKGVADEFFF